MQPPSVIVIPRPPSATSTSRPLSRRQFALSLRRRDFLPEVDHEDRRSELLGAQDDDDHFLGTFASINNDATFSTTMINSLANKSNISDTFIEIIVMIIYYH